MIGSSLNVVGLQHLSQFLDLLARQAIDDTTLAWILLDEANDLLVDVA